MESIFAKNIIQNILDFGRMVNVKVKDSLRNKEMFIKGNLKMI